MIERSLEVNARQVAGTFAAELHGSETAKAAAFLRKAEEASETQRRRIITGLGQGGKALESDTTYREEGENNAGEHSTAATTKGGAEDGEILGKALSAANLQSQQSQLQDCTRLRILEATL